MASYGYSTIPSVHERSAGNKSLVLVAAGCAVLGAAAGLAVSSATNLHVTTSTRPVLSTVAAVPAAPRAMQGNFESVTALNSASTETYTASAPSQSPLSGVFGGFAVAAAATVGAFAAYVLQGSKSAKTNPLAISKYEAAEAQWSMMAATAFVGTQAPDFKATAVVDEEFVDLTLSQYRGKKYVVLFFYPLDFTFVCPTEITAFSDRAAEFEALDTQIVGVSVDSQFSHLAWIQTPRNQGGLGDLKYPLVADLKKQIAESYGVLTEEGIALRGLFIIDKEGIIQHATINNLAFGRNVDETLRVLEALQHVQANPDEVCPAGWKKGDKTMKPDPVGSKEYFKAI